MRPSVQCVVMTEPELTWWSVPPVHRHFTWIAMTLHLDTFPGNLCQTHSQVTQAHSQVSRFRLVPS